MDLKLLASQIATIHDKFYRQATAAVNTALTLRNWWIGAYIVEYEQNGEDRASYGSGLLPRLVKEIGIKGLSETNLKQSRTFYLYYSHLFEFVLEATFPDQIRQTSADELQLSNNHDFEIRQMASDEFNWLAHIANRIRKSDIDRSLKVEADKIVRKLSFSHLVELIKIRGITIESDEY
ncbi:MAG: DUF1016 N-terminal domain-containing protein [Bacteroidia bacterium]|nr:DUF1016 N-terminal domain-containing protein [Bacteroidia bacterium]